MSIDAIWDRTTAWARARFGVLAAVAALTMVLPNLLTGLLQALFAANSSGQPPMLGGVRLLESVVMLWGYLIVTALALDPGLSGRGAAQLAARRLPAALLVMLLVTVAIGLCLGVLSIAAILLGAQAGAASLTMSAGAFASSVQRMPGSLALILLGLAVALVWLSARLTPLLPVVVAERLGVRTIPRAFSLSRGWGLRLAGLLVLFSFVAGVAVFAAGGAVGSIAGLFAGAGRLATALLVAFAAGVVSSALTVLALGFCAFFTSARARQGRQGTATSVPTTARHEANGR